MTRLFAFIGAETGAFRVSESRAIVGEALPEVQALTPVPASDLSTIAAPSWVLRGMVSNERYVTRSEKDELLSRQEGLGRASSQLAAMIPLKKSAAWWALTQSERRAIFEESSAHTQIGLRYLPAIARRLHHCRDLSESEPFDFVTWFEFSRADEPAFSELLQALRETLEWTYVEREVELRLERLDA